MSSPDAPLLAIREVQRAHGDLIVLAEVSASVEAGQCLVVLGPNGSGKSTLLRIAAGRDASSQGEVRLHGAPVTAAAAGLRASVAAVGDDSTTFPDLTVREHLELVATAHGARTTVGRLVSEALREWGLDTRADAFPSTLSAGQLQKLFLAAAFVRPRQLLVLDEPEQRLDTAMRRVLTGRLLAEKAAGVGVLLATHSRDLAAQVADKVLVLEDGRVRLFGETDAVLITLAQDDAAA